MQYEKRPFLKSGKSFTAALLIGMVLLLDAMAACPALHELIHHDADKPGHECAVTLFAHGLVDSAAVSVPVVTPIFWIETTPQIKFSTSSTAIAFLPNDRAPPVLPAVS